MRRKRKQEQRKAKQQLCNLLRIEVEGAGIPTFNTAAKGTALPPAIQPSFVHTPEVVIGHWSYICIEMRVYTDSLPITLDSGGTTLRLDRDKVYQMKRNIRQMLQNPNHPRVAYHQCSDFDVMEAILSQPKQQPESNLKKSLEEENEPKLQSVTGDIVIINDK